MQNPASLSDLSSVVNTDVLELKTPVGAIAGGKFFVKLLTLSAMMLPVQILFVRADRWFGRAVTHGTCTALLSQTWGAKYLKSVKRLDRCLCSTLKKGDLVREWRSCCHGASTCMCT